MSQMRQSAMRLWIAVVVSLGLTACGTPETPIALPPTATVAFGSLPSLPPTTQARQSPPPLEYDSPHCYTEAKDPNTGEGLTDADCAEATQLALGDSRVQQLLDSLSYHWQMVVLWHRDGGGIIGAWVAIDLAEPAPVDGEWLGLAYDCTTGVEPPYHSIAYRQAFTNVHQVSVWVDLNLHKVVGIEPWADPRYDGSPVGTPELVDPQATWPPGCPHQD